MWILCIPSEDAMAVANDVNMCIHLNRFHKGSNQLVQAVRFKLSVYYQAVSCNLDDLALPTTHCPLPELQQVSLSLCGE